MTTVVRNENLERPSARPGSVTLEQRADGRLWARRGAEERPVWVRRCFPWSAPTRWVSLRDDEDEEFALVRDASELDPASRRVLEEALLGAGFVFEVVRVLAIEEEVEIRHWRVETQQGARSFQTRLDDWPRVLPGAGGGGLLLRDVAGDLYRFTDVDRLDKRSRELLWAFVD
jgi:Domain of unknown function (DUF1854)